MVFGGLFTVVGIIAFFTVVAHELSRFRIDWMDVMASSLFLVFFVVPGAALVRWSLNRKTVVDLIAQARDEGVPSEEKRLYRVFYIIAAFLSATAVPILIGGIIEKKSGPMAMLLFLVIAAGFLWAGKRMVNGPIPIRSRKRRLSHKPFTTSTRPERSRNHRLSAPIAMVCGKCWCPIPITRHSK